MKKTAKKTQQRQVKKGKIFIRSSFNNTVVAVTDETGGVLAWSSAGASGFKGARKSTPYAAGIAMKNALDKIRNTGLQTVDIVVRGVGSGRDAAVRAIQSSGLTVTGIRDLTPIAHNGVRPKKPRRV